MGITQCVWAPPPCAADIQYIDVPPYLRRRKRAFFWRTETIKELRASSRPFRCDRPRGENSAKVGIYVALCGIAKERSVAIKMFTAYATCIVRCRDRAVFAS